MAAFGLSLDSPLLPNVDIFINPTKGEDEHRSALNAVVLNIHRAGAGAFEGLVTNQLGEYLSNSDSKVRERATLLLAELLARLPTLPLSAASAARFAGFFSSRLGDYPSVVPALKALSGLLKNHSPALFGGEDASAAAAGEGGGSSRRSVPAPAVAAGVDGGAGGAGDGGTAGVIARGVFEELHLPALSQSIRQAALSVLLALVTHPGSTEALSSGMGKAFVDGLVGSLEGEKDPRCLIVGLSALRKTQQGFDPAVLQETSEAVFDATACYFPVTFTPPPNDPHNISPDALRTGLEGVLVGSPGMAPHVLPMLLDKLSSEVSTAKEASLKAMVAGVRAFGAPGVGVHLRAIGGAMSEEAVHGSDPDLAALALLSLTEVVRETASHAVLTGLGEACPEWRALAKPLLEGAVAEVTGDQPCSVLGRGSARVLLALAASSALGLRSALALAVPRLLRARKDSAAAAAAMKRDVSALEGGSTTGCCGGGGGAAAGGGGCCGGGGGGHEDAMVTSGGGTAVADAEAFEDAQTARLGALAGLAAAVDDKVDFSGSQGGAPLQPYVDPLLSEFSAALTGHSGHSGGGGEASSLPPQAAPAAARPPSAAAAATVSLASRGLSDVITRPPASLVEEGKIQDVVRSLVAVLASPGAWEGRGGEEEGGSGVGEGTAALAVLTALRSIGLRRPEYARAVLDTAMPPLLKQLPHVRPPPPAGEKGESTCPPGGENGGASNPPSSPAGTAAAAAAAEGERACAALVELSEVPGVFAIALSALLAACTCTADRGSAATERPLLRCTPGAEIALRALDDTLKRGAKRGHHGDEILVFVRGAAPPPLLWPSCPPSATAAPPPVAADGAAVPSAPPTTAKEERQSKDSSGGGGAGSDGLWGLPLLLAALDASLAGPEEGGTSSSAETAGVAGGSSGGGDRSAGAETSALSHGALAAVVSTARTCTQAAPVDDQEALLSSLLSTLLPPPSPTSATGGGGGGGAVVGAIEKHSALLPVLASVMGAVRLDSKALRGPGGAAVAAVPSLLSGALAEGAAGLIEEPLTAGGGGGGGAAGARRAPCCQCLAAVLNKLAGGAEVDSAVALVVTALTEAFSREGEGAMDVDGAAAAAGEGPVQCLAWTLKAVAMRGGIGDAFSDLLGLLCGLLTAGQSRAGDETPSRRALAAAAAFGVALGDDGEVLRADADGGSGDGGGGARVSPLWKQRFFVQTFPKLLMAARGPARTRTGGDEDSGSSCDEDMAEQQATATDATTAGGGSAGSRVPALLALMRVVRGVPLEAISQQQQQRDTAVSAVVQALRSDYQPLQAEALETFQVLSRDDLTAFNQHLSSVIPLLLSLAEARNGSRTRSTGAPVNHSDAQGPGVDGSLRGGRSGPMERFRAVRCLTALTALPYSRLHPFKTQVTRRLRGPLDDDRRAIRQAAAEARNIWFLLG